MSDAMNRALLDCEALLDRERRNGADEALLAAKEAALEGLEASLKGWRPDADEAQSIAPRLRAVLAANRFSLKWSDLRSRLGRIGQAREPRKTDPARPRIDLVH